MVHFGLFYYFLQYYYIFAASELVLDLHKKCFWCDDNTAKTSDSCDSGISTINNN